VLATTRVATAEETDDDFYCQMYKFNGTSIMEEIVDQSGIDVDFSFKKIFTGTRKKPKADNLYMSLYKQVQETPDDTAMQQTADENQMSATELCNIFGGNYQLLRGIYDTTYDTESLLDEVTRLESDYEDNLEKAEQDQEMFLNTYAKEVFVNGDESDSGFDVLYDLALIEYVLFGENSSLGSGEDLGLNIDDNGSGAFMYVADAIEDLIEDDEEEDPSEADDDEDSPEAEDPSEEEEEDPEEEVNPAECLADSDVQSAFAEADENDGDDGVEDEDDEGDGGDEGDGQENDDGDLGDEENDGEEDDEDDDDSGDGWGDNHQPPCNEVFCITVDFKNLGSPQFETSSNCVKCHVDYIVEALDATTSQNLNPGKLSGNLLEPSVCKKSMTAAGISLNFIPIAMPIQTPPADDIIDRNNFAENFMDFLKDTWPNTEWEKFPDVVEGEEASDEEEENPLLRTNTTVESDIIEKSLQYEKGIDDGYATAEDIFGKAMDNYQTEIDEIEDKFSSRNMYAKSMAAKNFYQDIRVEMDQMNFYFSSYQTLILQTQEVVTKHKESIKNAS
jgi:hypothetical protein